MCTESSTETGSSKRLHELLEMRRIPDDAVKTLLVEYDIPTPVEVLEALRGRGADWVRIEYWSGRPARTVVVPYRCSRILDGIRNCAQILISATTKETSSLARWGYAEADDRVGEKNGNGYMIVSCISVPHDVVIYHEFLERRNISMSFDVPTLGEVTVGV